MEKMRYKVFVFASLIYKCAFGMNNLTDSQASEIYKQVISMDFIGCDKQIKELENFYLQKKELYWNKMKADTDNPNDDDFCLFSHYSLLSQFFSLLTSYLQNKDKDKNASRLVNYANLVGTRAYKAVNNLIK